MNKLEKEKNSTQKLEKKLKPIMINKIIIDNHMSYSESFSRWYKKVQNNTRNKIIVSKLVNYLNNDQLIGAHRNYESQDYREPVHSNIW